MRAIVSGFAGDEWGKVAEVTWPRMLDYAGRHGVVFLPAVLAKRSRPLPWSKLWCIASAFIDFDEVLWLDADVLIVDPSTSIFDEFAAEADTAMVRHPVPSHLNTGVWLLRRRMNPILVDAAMRDEYVHHPWWEQAAIHACLDAYGDRIKVQEIGPEWNACRDIMPESPRFLHACGMHGPGEQLDQIRKWAAER